jgi:hypothetical protein
MNIDIETVILSGIAALVGSAVSLLAVYLTHRWEKKKEEEREKEIIFGFYQAIHDEVETLWEIYMERSGNQIETLKNNEPVLFYWPVGFDYFTVFNNNNFLISRIKDNDLRKEIVTTYTLAKGLVDTFRFNNDLIYKYEQACTIYHETQLETHQAVIQSQHAVLSDYGNSIKQGHFIFKEKVNSLLRNLRKQGVLSK